MVLTFAINSSVEILDFYVDKCFWLRSAPWASIRRRASGFHTCFGPPQALWASIQVLWEFQTWSFKVFDCLLALMSALGFPARCGRYHQHWLVGAVQAHLASTGIGSWQVPEQGVDRQPPAASLPWPLCFQ